MTAPKLCAHCGSDNYNDSMDRMSSRPCPACLQPVCVACRKNSGPTDCRSYADDAPALPTPPGNTR